MLLPGNSVVEAISLKNIPIFTEIIFLLIRQNTIHMVKGIDNAFDHMELCLVINLTKDGNWTIPRPQIFATGHVSFATDFYTR